MSTCDFCDGTGRHEPRAGDYYECEECNGTGVVCEESSEDEDDDCWFCDGTGRHEPRAGDYCECPKCLGTGKQ